MTTDPIREVWDKWHRNRESVRVGTGQVRPMAWNSEFIVDCWDAITAHVGAAPDPTYTRDGNTYCKTCGTSLGIEEDESDNR